MAEGGKKKTETEIENEENMLTVLALKDVFGVDTRGALFSAASKLKAAFDSGILQYPKPDKFPHEKVLVLHITTSFGKRYTCRTVEQLETYIDNIKKEKKLKRDEEVDIQIGFGRMTRAAYDSLPACKYFIKT